MAGTVTIYNGSVRKGITSKAFDCCKSEELMREYTLTFSVTNSNPIYPYINETATYEYKEQMFDTAGIDTDSGSSNITQITAEHVSYRLNNYEIAAGYAFVGTVAQIAQDLLNGAYPIYDDYGVTEANATTAAGEFTIGECADLGTLSFSLNNTSAKNAKDAVLCLQRLGVEVNYDNLSIDFPVSCGSDTGKVFEFGKDLATFRRRWVRGNGWTYDATIANLQRVPGHEGDVFEKGDTVKIKDSFIGDSITTRIVTYKEHDDPTKDTIVLGKFIRDSEDDAIALEITADTALNTANNSVQVGTLYNSVSISHDKGFASVSGDGTSRKFDNGTDGYIIQVMYNGNWTTVYEANKGADGAGLITTYTLDHTQKVVQGGTIGVAMYKLVSGSWVQTGGQNADGETISTKLVTPNSTNYYGYIGVNSSGYPEFCLVQNANTTPIKHFAVWPSAEGDTITDGTGNLLLRCGVGKNIYFTDTNGNPPTTASTFPFGNGSITFSAGGLMTSFNTGSTISGTYTGGTLHIENGIITNVNNLRINSSIYGYDETLLFWEEKPLG